MSRAKIAAAAMAKNAASVASAATPQPIAIRAMTAK